MIGPRIGPAIGPRGGPAVGSGEDAIAPGSAIFLIGMRGQSNTPGRKLDSIAVAQMLLSGISAATATSEWTRVSATLAAVQFYDTEFTNATPPVVIYPTAGPPAYVTPGPLALRPSDYGTGGNYGAEMALGHDLQEHVPGRWAIAKYALGGTDLFAQWLPTGTYPAAAPNNLDGLSKAWFADAERRFGAVLAIEIWNQGESDALDGTKAAAYLAGLEAHGASLWAFRPACKIVIPRLSTGNTMPFAADIRAAQDAFAAAHPTQVYLYRIDEVPIDSPATQGHQTQMYSNGHNAYPIVLNALNFRLGAVAAFEFQAKTLAADFFDVSTDPNVLNTGIVAWAWDFGDLATSTAQNPSHTYAANGSYTVRLVVTKADGGTAATSQTITVATPTWTVDATSGEGFPVSAAEFAAFVTAHSLTQNGSAMAVPYGYNCQDVSGSVANTFTPGATKNMSLSGLPTFQQTVTGYTRKFIGASGAATTQSAANATFADIATTDVIQLGLVKYNSSTVNTRALYSGGSGVTVNAVTGVITTGKLQKRTGATLTSGNVVHSDGSPHFLVSRFSPTDSKDSVLSDLEKIENPFGASSGTRIDLSFSLSTDTAVNNQHGYHLRWDGARMTDAEIKHLIQALGRRVRWQ